VPLPPALPNEPESSDPKPSSLELPEVPEPLKEELGLPPDALEPVKEELGAAAVLLLPARAEPTNIAAEASTDSAESNRRRTLMFPGARVGVLLLARSSSTDNLRSVNTKCWAERMRAR
jgi:hypothetical protein